MEAKMKILHNLGAVLSVACMVGFYHAGVASTNAFTPTDNTYDNFLTLEDHRMLAEQEAEQFVAELGEDQLHCLARNIFFESRGEPLEGQVAVAWVTLNRVESDRYPDTICGVVRQANRDSEGNIIRHQCQFSWYCDGRSDAIPSNSGAQQAWRNSQNVAEAVLMAYAAGEPSPVEDATMFHADWVNPYWADDYTHVDTIGVHLFYR
jgi:spore germination cell wall hydrolase CwlJ-like protein